MVMGFLRLFKRHKPKINIDSNKKDGFSGWVKCTKCEEMVHANELQEHFHCCPKCDHHYRLSGKERIDLLADQETFTELFGDIVSKDPLAFVDVEPYSSRLSRAEEKTGRREAVIVGTCHIEGMCVALGVLDFGFMGGSMGAAVGERMTLLIEEALERGLPVIFVSSSGGARMQESIFSLMQMAKISAALAKLSKAGLPYISVLTNPTTGGVTASFASLGDLIIAEPDALIGFAGRRVVEQTIREKLPDAAQKSEFLLEKGMVDCVVRRSELKSSLHFFLEFFQGNSSAMSDKKKLDEILAFSKKARKKNTIHVTSSRS